MFFTLGVLSQFIFGPLLFLLSIFIIAVILLQRGKGGGLTGALGGLGGQSAFGVKAGDLFTRITAVAVLLWIFVCALACRWYLPEDLDIKADVGASTSIGGGIEVPKSPATIPPEATPSMEPQAPSIPPETSSPDSPSPADPPSPTAKQP